MKHGQVFLEAGVNIIWEFIAQFSISILPFSTAYFVFVLDV
jgi:hypothetical protein